MPGTHPPYAPEYRRRIIELARAGALGSGAGAGVRAVSQRDPQLGEASSAR